MAEFKDRFSSAGAEFRVALSGPLVSIGLGVLFVAIALAGLPSAVDGAAAWLGYINLILAAFNLLPASPLDGVPSESEMRVAQAQLVGWLEGLFHGIQAAMFAQQAAARQQFEELRRRGLLSQNPGSPDEGPPEGAPRGGRLTPMRNANSASATFM